MTHDDARALSSDFLDGTLDADAHRQMDTFFAAHPDAQAEIDGLRRTLSVLHALPPREPSLDLWREFTPHMAAFTAERRLPPNVRLRQMLLRLLDGMGAGLILWTDALAGRTRARWERHLLHDPLLHDSLARQGNRE